MTHLPVRRPPALSRTAMAAALAPLLAGCPPAQRPTPPSRTQPPTPPARVQPAAPVHPPHPAAVWPPRAIWVVRQAFTSPQQVTDLIEQCRRAGFNTVLFQVRGNGTVCYPSRLEPWAEEYPAGNPGFDPLAVAVTEAHRRGMALHAWVNVMPAWRGALPPRNPRQLYHTRPDWFLRDQAGRLQPLGEFYLSLNPCLPDVRRYLTALFEEIVTRYAVDGLHLDYIRFPLEKTPKGSDYPYDLRTLQLYRQATGRHPRDSRPRWTAWRQLQVTQLVRDVHAMTRRARPGLRLTAACLPDVRTARAESFQDAPAWLQQGLLDAAFVMNYTDSPASFRRRQEAWMRAAPGRWVVPGLGLHLHPRDDAALEQLALADAWGRGFALFSSNALFGADPRSRQRLDALRPRLLDLQRRAAR